MARDQKAWEMYGLVPIAASHMSGTRITWGDFEVQVPASADGQTARALQPPATWRGSSRSSLGLKVNV